MTEQDDKLIADFFANQRQEIADQGFTRRVMRRLPDRNQRLSQLWSSCGFALALALFVALDGVQLVLDTLRETFTTLAEQGSTHADPKSLLIAGIVLLYLGYRKICSLA